MQGQSKDVGQANQAELLCTGGLVAIQVQGLIISYLK